MQRIKPMGKGDPLCPLGFHPQVRWPTRCKRCFRDYKEHGNRNRDNEHKLNRNEITASSPSLTNSRGADDRDTSSNGTRSWISTSNLNTETSLSPKLNDVLNSSSFGNGTSSWTSTPDLASLSDNMKANLETTVNVTLPRRRHAVPEVIQQSNEDDYRRTQYTVRRRTTSLINSRPTSKNSIEENETHNSSSSSENNNISSRSSKTPLNQSSMENQRNIFDLDFLIRMRDGSKNDAKSIKTDDSGDHFSDACSTINTEESDATLVNESCLQDQIENLKDQLAETKAKCERAERERNDMLLRRVASLDNSASTKTTSSELYKLQKKINELKNTCDELQTEKKTLSGRVAELENDVKSSKNEKEIEELKSKLQAAESLCEELMDENEDMKKELKDMEDEIEEMQDNFRENEADEYSTIKKELEQTGKNCRILSFKLRKVERKAEQLEADKLESERKSREAIQKLQKDLEEANEKIKSTPAVENSIYKKKAPMLGTIPKTSSSEKMSRASLTRGGSQEDPVQLQRDLQDSIEREADLREQLRYAEEEAENLRKKVTRVEDENESLMLQLKKMATKARSRKSSPTSHYLTPESTVEKDEGISDEEDPAELRILLELNEQESAVLRKKVEELEQTCDILKRKTTDLQEKLLMKEQRVTSNRVNKIQDTTKKMKEVESNELRNKLIEKERECNELKTQISCGSGKAKVLQKSRSLDGDSQTVDLRQQLKLVEQEASVLRIRIFTLESDNEKLNIENKQLLLRKDTRKESKDSNELKTKIITNNSDDDTHDLANKDSCKKLNEEIVDLKNKYTELEKENARLKNSINIMKNGTLEKCTSFYKNRTAKKPTDMTSKNAMKKMVEDLENEIGEILVSFQKCDTQYKQELEKLQSNLDESNKKTEKMLNEHKENIVKLEKEKDRILNEKKSIESAKLKLEETINKDKNSHEQLQKNTLESQKQKYLQEIENLKKQITNLSNDLRNYQNKNSETNDQLAVAYKELEQQRSLVDSLKNKLEIAQTSAKDSVKLIAQISEKTKRIADLEKKLKDVEDKSKKSDRLLQAKKEKIFNLEKELEATKKVNNEMKQAEKENLNEKSNLKKKIEELEHQINTQVANLTDKQLRIQQLDRNISELKENDKKSSVSNSIAALERKLSEAEQQITTYNQKLEKITEDKKKLEDTSQSVVNDLRNEINHWKANAAQLELDIQVERDELSKYKSDTEKKLQDRDKELKSLRSKFTNNVDNNSIKKEYDSKLESLEVEIKKKRKEYTELNEKYDNLQDEYKKSKFLLNSETEKIGSQLTSTKRELTNTQNELRTLRDTFNSRQDGWIKERLQLEEKLKEMKKVSSSDSTSRLEHTKLKSLYDLKLSEFDQLKKESQIQLNQLEHMRKDNEQLQKKLDDYEKVSKVQRNMLAETTAVEDQLREMKNRLYNEEKGRKVEIAALKIRYENHVSAISDELKDVQSQLMRFKHERDTYKHLLEDTQQKSLSGQRNAGTSNSTIQDDEEVNELRNEVATLEQQISCMEDELSEARVESSRIKTELVSERSAWEVKISEMMSRINELEEERLLHSGRTKMPGLKTRIELAWHKEREEQNRLLQETSTLARDLRQTLFEVERERDKDRLESKRRLGQMKKNMEEEQEETKKKLSELQCDLLELRDAHAKLRTTNEKLRREKDRLERDKELIKQSIAKPSSTDEDEQRKIAYIMDLISELLKIAPQHYSARNSPIHLPPPIPKRNKNTYSRESSFDSRTISSRESSVPKEEHSTILQTTLQKLSDAMRQLKPSKNKFNKDGARKSFTTARSASTEAEAVQSRGIHHSASLRRKCISLDQTAQNDQAIWRAEEDTDGSISSFQSYEESYGNSKHQSYGKDSSFDSRLSGGSTQSEIIGSAADKKKKSSIFGKLKKLTKSSKSIDNEDMYQSNNQFHQSSNSSMSTNAIDHETHPKKHLKSRITNMFKKSDSRSNSLDRNCKSSCGNLENVVAKSPTLNIRSSTLPRISLPPDCRNGNSSSKTEFIENVQSQRNLKK